MAAAATSTKKPRSKKAADAVVAAADTTAIVTTGADVLSLEELLAIDGQQTHVEENIEPANPVLLEDSVILSVNAALEESNEPLGEADLLASLLDGALETDTGVVSAVVAADSVAIVSGVVAADVSGATPAPKKEPSTPRPATSDKTSVKIAHRLGDKAGDYLLLEITDAELSAEDLAAKQAEMMKGFDATSQIKVREKMVQLFGYMRNGGKLNEVMRRAFTVLIAEGQLTSGDKGNLHLNLLTKPYSAGTARAQSGQIFSLFPALKIVVKSERGIYVANPNSMILETMKAALASA